LVEEQGQCIEVLEADLERLQCHSNNCDDKLRDLIREWEDCDSRVAGRFRLLSQTMFNLGASAVRIKRILRHHPMGCV
jgi:hypothetical protein